jgi:hypothetical protein
VYARIGTLTLPPGDETPAPHWGVALDGANTWNSTVAKKAVAQLKNDGYIKPGYVETVRSDFDASLSTTSAFELRSAAADWPDDEQWQLTQVHYEPTDQCALLSYRSTDAAHYDLRLVHLYAPNARLKRAHAHLENGLVLAKTGDLSGGLEEASIAVQMTPLDHISRYHHAALLCLSGRPHEALDELQKAVSFDPQDAKRAKKDIDFESLRDDQRFQALISGRIDKTSSPGVE